MTKTVQAPYLSWWFIHFGSDVDNIDKSREISERRRTNGGTVSNSKISSSHGNTSSVRRSGISRIRVMLHVSRCCSADLTPLVRHDSIRFSVPDSCLPKDSADTVRDSELPRERTGFHPMYSTYLLAG